VYAGDVARAVEICCRDDPEVVKQVGGKIVEAGGPDGELQTHFRSVRNSLGLTILDPQVSGVADEPAQSSPTVRSWSLCFAIRACRAAASS
jgi:hypothetical protein